MPETWEWLASTRELQERSFGVDYAKLKGDELADYITFNATALTAELGEFLQEIGWKPWASSRGWYNREAALKEAVDIGHFLANLLCAIGVTDDEWRAAYQRKQGVNRTRMLTDYDGVTSKCVCGRAFDDSDCTPIECARRP